MRAERTEHDTTPRHEDPVRSEGWDPIADWQVIMDDEIHWVGPAYELARARGRIVRTEGSYGGFWAVLDFDELTQAAEDTATFSSMVPLFDTSRPPLEVDPPEHTAYRRLLNPFFSAEAMRTLEPTVRRYVTEMLDPLISQGSGDFAHEVAHPLPTRVLCELIGLPNDRWHMINDFAMAVDRVGAVRPGDPSRSEVAQSMVTYLRTARRDRAHHERTTDMIEALGQAQIDGRSLSESETLGILLLMVSAGHNTTTSALGNLVLRLSRDHSLQGVLRANPSRIPDAIEECLRIDSPQQAMRRVARVDASIAGQAIKKGDFVWLVFGAANVDPKHWDAPETFDIDRRDRRHLAFGRGIHRCVGAPLARLQMRIVIEHLLRKTLLFSLSGPPERPAWPRMGVTSLPLLFES
jgi:cytochrome P450